MEAIKSKQRCPFDCVEHILSLANSNGDNKYDRTIPEYNLDKKHYTNAFVLGTEKKAVRQNLQQQFMHFQTMVKDACEKNNQIFFPRPNEKNSFCSVCKEHYFNYYEHIRYEPHREKIEAAIFNSEIKKLCEEYRNKWEGSHARADRIMEDIIKENQELIKMQQKKETASGQDNSSEEDAEEDSINAQEEESFSGRSELQLASNGRKYAKRHKGDQVADEDEEAKSDPEHNSSFVQKIFDEHYERNLRHHEDRRDDSESNHDGLEEEGASLPIEREPQQLPQEHNKQLHLPKRQPATAKQENFYYYPPKQKIPKSHKQKPKDREEHAKHRKVENEKINWKKRDVSGDQYIGEEGEGEEIGNCSPSNLRQTRRKSHAEQVTENEPKLTDDQKHTLQKEKLILENKKDPNYKQPSAYQKESQAKKKDRDYFRNMHEEQPHPSESEKNTLIIRIPSQTHRLHKNNSELHKKLPMVNSNLNNNKKILSSVIRDELLEEFMSTGSDGFVLFLNRTKNCEGEFGRYRVVKDVAQHFRKQAESNEVVEEPVQQKVVSEDDKAKKVAEKRAERERSQVIPPLPKRTQLESVAKQLSSSSPSHQNREQIQEIEKQLHNNFGFNNNREFHETPLLYETVKNRVLAKETKMYQKEKQRNNRDHREWEWREGDYKEGKEREEGVNRMPPYPYPPNHPMHASANPSSMPPYMPYQYYPQQYYMPPGREGSLSGRRVSQGSSDVRNATASPSARDPPPMMMPPRPPYYDPRFMPHPQYDPNTEKSKIPIEREDPSSQIGLEHPSQSKKTPKNLPPYPPQYGYPPYWMPPPNPYMMHPMMRPPPKNPESGTNSNIMGMGMYSMYNPYVLYPQHYPNNPNHKK